MASCAGRTPLRSSALEPARPDIDELWVEPHDIQLRDLFHGPGGPMSAPAEGERYVLVAEDTSGFSHGYDVRDRQGTAWSVKVGIEAQSEVAASRLLWAIGFHQPATYLIQQWALESKVPVKSGPARFRLEQPAHKVTADWSWYENPFVGTQPFKGLIVANLMLNNWDWKTSNNKVYEVTDGSRVHRTYIVRDLGASLGKTSFPAILRWGPFRMMAQGSRNHLEDFERQDFIKARDGDEVDFDYRGVHPQLVDTLTVTDVAWTCQLFARLSDLQLQDAFRAAAYDAPTSLRFIAKLKAKIRQGLSAVEDRRQEGA
jgi:hypothetical protein